jgi:hypothetical protein
MLSTIIINELNLEMNVAVYHLPEVVCVKKMAKWKMTSPLRETDFTREDRRENYSTLYREVKTNNKTWKI